MADAKASDAGQLEQLLQDSAWVRRLALALAGNAAAAEDAAQDAWVAALHQVQQGRAISRGWWAVVLRNRLSVDRRSEERLRARESVAARSEQLPDVADTVERLEQQQVLLRAVSELEEPYRTTIRLRWLEGLSPAEIAARQGAPVRTVHTRLNRGLALLRRRLGGPGQPPWYSSALVALLRRATPVASGLLTLMKTKTKLAALAAVATLAVLIWIPLRDRETAQAVDQNPNEVASATAPATGSELASPGVSERHEEAARDVASAVAPSVAPALPHARARGRVVDLDGNPIPQVRVALEWRDGEEEAGEDSKSHAPAAERLETHSDSQGEFELTIPIVGTRTAALTLSKPPHFATHTSTLGRPTHPGQPALVPGNCALGELSLRPAYVLSGHVRDEGGAPIEGAQVVAGPVIGSSARDGSYLLECVDVNYRAVTARKPGYLQRTIKELTPSPARGGTSRAEFTLERAHSIAGVVVDADGQPVADAQVLAYVEILEPAADPFRPPPAETRSAFDGTFEIDLKDDREHRLMAFASGVARAPGLFDNARADVPTLAPGTRNARVQLEPYELAHITARNAHSGATIAEFNVRAVRYVELPSTFRMMPGTSQPRISPSRTASSGAAVVEFDAQQRWYQCEAPGYALAAGELESGTRAEKPQVILMEPEGRARGLVLDGAHALVVMERQHPEIASMSKMQIDLLPTGMVQGYDLNKFNGRRRMTRCAADGHFEIVGLNAGTYRLTVYASNHAATHFEPIRIEAGSTHEFGELQPEVTAAVEGVVLVAPGTSPEGLRLRLRESAEKSQRVGADGRFAFSGLARGTYEIRADDHSEHGSFVPPLSVSLARGERKHVAWEIVPARLRVHVHERGEGLSDVRLELRNNPGFMGTSTPFGSTDSQGSASGIVQTAPNLFLLASSKHGVALGGLPIDPRLNAGEQRELDFAIESGSLLARWTDMELPDEFFEDPSASIQFSLQPQKGPGFFGVFKATAAAGDADDSLRVSRDRTVLVDRIAAGDWFLSAQLNFRSSTKGAKPVITRAHVRIDPAQWTEALFELSKPK